MTFHEVRVEDGRWARPLLQIHAPRDCEYSFTNLYMWSHVYRTRIARFEDFVIVRSQVREGRLQYLYPAGRGDAKSATDAILADAAANGRVPFLYSLTQRDVAFMQQCYPGRFRYEQPQSEADYVYNADELATLPGKKFQKKRNHCSRFERMYPNWEFREIGPEAMDAVCAFNNEWCRLYDNRGDEGIEEEHKAIQLACRHYGELGLAGGYITVDGRVVAFSFGSPISGGMFVTHVEKALYDISGAYNIINREMARRLCGAYTLINRENDVGEPGLREAKLSYHPAEMVEKYTAELIE